MDKLRKLRQRLQTTRTVHEVEPESNLDVLLHGLIIALESRGGGDNSEVLAIVKTIDRKVDVMSSNIDRIEKEAADAAENVGLVRTAMEELKTVSEAMKTEIANLRQQVAQGQLDQQRLDQAAATFEKADDDIDALVLPSTPPVEPPVEGGGEGGGTTEGGGVITGDNQ